MSQPASNVHQLPSSIIDRRITMKLFISGYMVNFQGDPDNANHPRLDSNNHAYMTPMGPKRKARDMAVKMGHRIHVSRNQDLATPVLQRAADIGLDITEEDEPSNEANTTEKSASAKADKAKAPAKGQTKAVTDAKGVRRRKKGHALSIEDKDAIIKKMGEYYWDFKAFGATMTTIGHGETGPIQIGFGVTVDPVEVIELAIGRVAVANAKELETKDRTMGSLVVVKYGLMEFEMSISPWNARRVGLTWGDYSTFLQILTRMWDNSKSTGRGKIVVEKLVSFIHSSEIGDIQDARLTDAVQATWVNKAEGEIYPNSFKDYVITIDRSAIPKTVEVVEIAV